MVETDVASSSGIVVGSKDRFGLKFSKAIEIQLPGKGGEVRVFKVLWQDT